MVDSATQDKAIVSCILLKLDLVLQSPHFAEIQYLLGKPAESCTETCRKSGSTCLSNGHGFTNSSTTLSIFRSLNVVCKTGFSDNYDQYKHKDSPSYYTGKDLKPIGRCIGYKGVPETINCTRGHNVNVQRLCPCQGMYYMAISLRLR